MKVLPRGEVLLGDARAVLPTLLAESVDACVTSPPYPARLRDYGAAGQLGHEATIRGYVGALTDVLGGVKRVLKDSGSLWLNLGDAYAKRSSQGAPAGSLLLAPQRVALALSESGWLIRSVVIWQKTNPLPQSARDRLSGTYEVIIHATKTRRYFFDLDAIRVPHRTAGRGTALGSGGTLYQGGNNGLLGLRAAGRVGNPAGKNPGDVFTAATAVDRSGHQATYPEGLIERPLLATVPERICEQCDRAWTRPTRIVTVHTAEGRRDARRVGELTRCDCFAPSRPGVVLDPFCGTGTTAVVAERLGRDWLGIELNPAYRQIALERIDAARERAA